MATIVASGTTQYRTEKVDVFFQMDLYLSDILSKTSVKEKNATLFSKMEATTRATYSKI